MRTVLTLDPDQLDTTARSLRLVGAELRTTADRVAAWSEPSWSGLAALEQAARRREIAEATGQLAGPLEQVAGGVAEVALAAREHGDTVRRHVRLRDDLELERRAVLAVGAPPEPLAAARWAQRVAALQEESERHARLAEGAEREFEQVQRRVGALLDGLRGAVPQVVWDLGVTVMTVHKGVHGWNQVAAAGGMADAARRLHRRPGGARTRHRMQERVRTHVRRLKMHPPRWISKVPGGATVAGRAVPVGAGVDALHGAWTGGGYQGWRGGVTRGLAGGALVGLVVVVAAPAAATAGALGLSVAAVYQAWMTGNWVYDNRARIAGAATRGWAGTTRVAGRAWKSGRGLLARARQRAASGLQRLRDGHARTGRSRDPRPGAPVAPGPEPAGAQA